MSGAISTPVGMPASRSSATSLSRVAGAVARGSKVLFRLASSVVIEIITDASPSRAMAASNSMSRSMSAPLVTMETIAAEAKDLVAKKKDNKVKDEEVAQTARNNVV